MTTVAHLSRGQRAVLAELMCDGASNAQIAARLGICEDTVKAHMKAIFAACGCASRTELVVRLMRRQVVLSRTVRREYAAVA